MDRFHEAPAHRGNDDRPQVAIKNNSIVHETKYEQYFVKAMMYGSAPSASWAPAQASFSLCYYEHSGHRYLLPIAVRP